LSNSGNADKSTLHTTSPETKVLQERQHMIPTRGMQENPGKVKI
jgi:hypothetical protein